MDYQFCFPLKLNLLHRDYIKPVLFGLHLLSLQMVYITLGTTAVFIGMGVCMISLKYYFEQQETICKYDVLYGFGLDDWCLRRACGKESRVRLLSILMIGPFLIFRLRRHGDPLGWITSSVHQTPEDWHKIRVLNKR